MFWGWLAEFLLCVSDLVRYGHENCRGKVRCRCGLKPGARCDWIQERAYYSFSLSEGDDAPCGDEFLEEVVESVSKRSAHRCLRGLISRAEWLGMVEAVRVEPIEIPAMARFTDQAARQQELHDAVHDALRSEPLEKHPMVFFAELVGLPECFRSHHYVPMSETTAQDELDGVRRSTQAAPLAWKFCDIWKKRDCSDSFRELLRAAIFENMDVSDLPSIYGPERSTIARWSRRVEGGS